MAYTFNGSTATIADTANLRMVSSTDNDGNGKINITGSEQAKHQYEATLDDPEVTFEVLGADSISRGDTGETVITWYDGGSTSLGDSLVVGKSKAGSVDNATVYSITVVPWAGL